MIVATVYLIPTMHQAFRYFMFFVFLTTMIQYGYHYLYFINE